MEQLGGVRIYEVRRHLFALLDPWPDQIGKPKLIIGGRRRIDFVIPGVYHANKRFVAAHPVTKERLLFGARSRRYRRQVLSS
jgi:hypothetical protein